jgi:hypothetical protein
MTGSIGVPDAGFPYEVNIHAGEPVHHSFWIACRNKQHLLAAFSLSQDASGFVDWVWNARRGDLDQRSEELNLYSGLCQLSKPVKLASGPLIMPFEGHIRMPLRGIALQSPSNAGAALAGNQSPHQHKCEIKLVRKL